MPLTRTTIAFGYAAIAAVVGNTLLMWYKESHPEFQAALKATFTHHWIGHGIIVVGGFVLVGLLLSRVVRQGPARHLTTWLVAAVILSAVGIGGFYLLGY